MKVLMFSIDPDILRADTEPQKRMLDYGKLFEELHIVVYAKRQETKDKRQATIGNNIFIYPINIWFRPFYFFIAYRIAKKIIHNSKFMIHNSVITCQDPFETGFVGWLLKLRYKLPLQIQIHTDVFSPYFWKESLKNKLRVMLAKFLLPKADSIRVVSERIRQSLITQLPNYPIAQIIVLPIFVNVRKIQSARGGKKIKTNLHQKYPNYDFIVLMASRLTKEKNIEIAIKAMKELIKKYPKALLLIVGEGPEQKKLISRIKNCGLSDNAKIENWTDDLISYYKTADLFLLTSNYEGYGRTVIEAMAAGLPVVMTDVGLAGELLIDELDGRIVPVDDENALVKIIEELLENKEKKEGLVRESQKTIESLMPKDEYLRLYRESLENMPRSKPKLAYVLPKYQENDPTHFAYLHEFLRRIADSFDLFLIVERGTKPAGGFGYQRAQLSRFSLLPILYARFLGYKDFYVHYSFGAAFCASLVTRIFGGRVFYWNCGEPWKYQRNFIREFFERSTYCLIDFLITGTESLAKEYSSHYGISVNKIRIMPNWINLKEVEREKRKEKREELKNKLNIPMGSRVMLFVHRLSKRKGAHYLPEILNDLRNENIVLIIIGDGPERKNLESRIWNLELQDKVRFLGWVPNQEVLKYFAIADVFLMPSEEEGFPHVLLESMAMGIPFVASDVGGIKDIISEAMHHYLVKKSDTQQFIDKIKELLLKSPAELKEFDNQLRDWVERYNISSVIQRFIKIIG